MRQGSEAGDDPFNLQRFVDAQDGGGDFDRACAELRAGHKQTHWIWYVFPQLRGLGRSATAHHYGIASLDEARAYLAHPMLGPRLIQATNIVLAVETRDLHQIFGSPDDLKFHSCMTLFEAASDCAAPFGDALTTLCDGKRDDATLRLLSAG